MHRRNIAERVIQTRKDHFISVLAGVDAKFPLHKWDRLLPQATLTLILLRQPNVSPHVSAYAHHHGQFDYNRMSIAPMGCTVQIHEKPKQRKTFGEHAADGWYIRTSPAQSIIGVTSYLCARLRRCESRIQCTSSTSISRSQRLQHKIES